MWSHINKDSIHPTPAVLCAIFPSSGNNFITKGAFFFKASGYFKNMYFALMYLNDTRTALHGVKNINLPSPLLCLSQNIWNDPLVDLVAPKEQGMEGTLRRVLENGYFIASLKVFFVCKSRCFFFPCWPLNRTHCSSDDRTISEKQRIFNWRCRGVNLGISPCQMGALSPNYDPSSGLIYLAGSGNNTGHLESNCSVQITVIL